MNNISPQYHVVFETGVLKLTFLPSDRLLSSFLFMIKYPKESNVNEKGLILATVPKGYSPSYQEGIATVRKDVLLCFSVL